MNSSLPISHSIALAAPPPLPIRSTINRSGAGAEDKPVFADFAIDETPIKIHAQVQIDTLNEFRVLYSERGGVYADAAFHLGS